MADDEERRITQVVLDFLKKADMSVVTERMVLAHVDETLKLRNPIKEYKPMVSTIIDDYLSKIDNEAEGAEEEDDDEEGGDDDDNRAAGEAVGKKRGRVEPAAKKEAAKKKPRGTPGELLYAHNLGDRYRVEVLRANDKTLVDIRQLLLADGREKAFPKGLSLDAAQWARLAKDLPRLVEGLRRKDLSTPHTQFSRMRTAKVDEFKGTYSLNLREHYEKDGELKPGKKGILLPLEAALVLQTVAKDVTEAVGGPVDVPPPPEPTLGAAPTSIDSRETVVDLGGKKKMSLSHFKGRTSVDLREFYQSDGEWRPGKKGIALSPSDWQTLCDHMQEVNDVLRRKDMKYQLKLSGMRRVSLSEFRGVYYVAIREYYERDGQVLPGAKGLNMSPQEWAACVAGAPAITAALRSGS